MAELETLLARLKSDANKRPLLEGDLREKLSSLLAKREEHYAYFADQLRVDDKSSRTSAQQLQVQLGRHHLSAMGEYDVIVGDVGHALSVTDLRNPIIVTDENVAKFHLDRVMQTLGHDSKSVIILAGEEHKNLETVFVFVEFISRKQT